MTEVTLYRIVCTPLIKGGNIRSVTLEVVAKTKEEAMIIVETTAHLFFDQDLNMEMRAMLHGFRDDSSNTHIQ